MKGIYGRICIVLICIIVIAIPLYKYRDNLIPIKNTQPFTNIWDTYDKNSKRYDYICINMMKDLQSILRQKDIEFIVSYGTLLGLTRHEGFIPWDDDIDVIIDDKHYDTLIGGLDDKLSEKGLRILHINDKFSKIHRIQDPYIKNKNWSWPFIDIFMYTVIDDKVKIYDASKWKNYIISKSDFFPLKTNLFCGFPVSMPYNVDSVLSSMYGTTWETTCMSSPYNHREERSNEKQYMINCNNLSNLNDNWKNNIWVINLDRRRDRWIKIVKRLKEAGIHTAKRWKAIDGTKEKLKKNRISIGETACYKSHLSLWKKLYKDGVDSALIFEDDIIFAPGVNIDDIEETIKSSPGYTILFLGHCGSPETKFKNPKTKIGTAKCTHAYIISRKGLEILVNMTHDFFVPVDFITEQICRTNICYLSRHISSNYDENGIIHQDNSLGNDIPIRG
jgi:GR25 family glycosyltransferase involved in LPS biosynthesis/phosphorylcholine metabolism protein LicD